MLFFRTSWEDYKSHHQWRISDLSFADVQHGACKCGRILWDLQRCCCWIYGDGYRVVLRPLHSNGDYTAWTTKSVQRLLWSFWPWNSPSSPTWNSACCLWEEQDSECCPLHRSTRRWTSGGAVLLQDPGQLRAPTPKAEGKGTEQCSFIYLSNMSTWLKYKINKSTVLLASITC